MAFYKQDIVDINLNTGNIHRSFLNHAIGYKNDDADRFGIRTFRDGEPVDLTGVSCQAVFMSPNGSNIALTSYGTVSGNVAYVTLPPACYDYEGQFCLSIQLVGGGVTGTMRIVDGMVVNTGASGTVAPTSSVPTYQEIIAQYDAMVAATAAANGAIAATYSGSATYKVGDYCIHDGGLYRCTTAITTAEAWNAAHWTATKIGPDVSDLKSALTTGQYSDFADVVIPCSDGDATVTGYTVKKIGNALLFDGSRETNTQRYCIYGSFEYAGNSPSPTNHPEWYHTGLAEFIVGHVYKFRWRLISGSINRNGITSNFYFDMRTSSGGSQQIYLANDNVWGDEWTCTFAPEMIAFVSPKFIYSNAVILLDVVDKTKEIADFPMSDRFNVDSQAVILNCRLWHSETDGTYAYVKFGASNGRIYIRGFNTHATINPASYETSGLVVTSPSGVAECWKIPYNSALYFDREDSTVKIATSAYTSNSILLIYIGTSGQIQTNKTFLNETEIDSLKAQVADVIPYTVPDYFISHMTTQIAKIQTAINAGKTSNVSIDVEPFIFITDVHWSNNKQNSPALIKYIMNRTSIKTVICGGDLIESHNTTKEGALQEIHGFTDRIIGIPCFDYYSVYGNHDNNGNSNEDISIMLTPEEEYNALYAPFDYKPNVHWIWQDNPVILTSSAVKNDYYFDHPRTKTRYICIDWKNPFINTARATWFTSVLAKDDGYRVIVIYHGMWKPDFTPDRNNSEAIMSYIEPYKNKVVAVITGHTHVDSTPAVDYFGDGSVPVIVTACDTFDPSHNTGMVAGTYTEQCFDVFVVDYTNSKIKIIRIGNGSDREVNISLS